MKTVQKENEFTDEQWWRICVVFAVMAFIIGLSVGIGIAS